MSLRHLLGGLALAVTLFATGCAGHRCARCPTPTIAQSVPIVQPVPVHVQPPCCPGVGAPAAPLPVVPFGASRQGTARIVSYR